MFYAPAWGWMSTPRQPPVVYSDAYNITFFGLEKLHPFDSCKYRRVLAALDAAGAVDARRVVRVPGQCTREQLLDVHSAGYLDSLSRSEVVAGVVELPPLALLPNFVVQRRVLGPMRTMARGTVIAAGVAWARGFALNLGGGMHHASRDHGSGWCPYDDWYLALRQLRRATGRPGLRALYVDLDVHQGNGVARDKAHFGDAGTVYILDAFNASAYPADAEAKRGIDAPVPFPPGTGDAAYLSEVRAALDKAWTEFEPDIVLYNAGTDVLEGDPLGGVCVSAAGIAERDEAVLQSALDRGVPLVMATSGGYARRNWEVISASLLNLHEKFGIFHY